MPFGVWSAHIRVGGACLAKVKGLRSPAKFPNWRRGGRFICQSKVHIPAINRQGILLIQVF